MTLAFSGFFEAENNPQSKAYQGCHSRLNGTNIVDAAAISQEPGAGVESGRLPDGVTRTQRGASNSKIQIDEENEQLMCPNAKTFSRAGSKSRPSDAFSPTIFPVISAPGAWPLAPSSLRPSSS